MSEKDNPAERLYRLLTAARQINGGYVRQTISKITGVSQEPEDVFCEAAIQLYRLFDDMIERLRDVEDIDEEIFINPILRLQGAFPLIALNEGWNNYLPRLSEVDMVSLRHAIHELRRQPFPPPVEKAVLDKLQEDVTVLYNLVDEAETADIPEILRTIMLEGLWEILTAIRLHTARGTPPLQRSLLMNAGALVTYWPLFEQYKDAEEVSRYKGIVDNLRQIIPLAADASTLLGAGIQAVRALISGGH